jgi:hypothetical protein
VCFPFDRCTCRHATHALPVSASIHARGCS